MKCLVVLLLMLIAQSSSALELRGKIVVLDTQIAEYQLYEKYLCENGSISVELARKSTYDKDYTFSMKDHGENVVGLIGKQINTSKYCVFHVAVFFMDSSVIQTGNYLSGLQYAGTLPNVVGINLSLSGRDPLNNEFKLINELSKDGVAIVVAAGNNDTKLDAKHCSVYPACLKLKVAQPKNFYIVGNNGDNNCSNTSTDKVLDFHYENGENVGTPKMSGTSQATAVFTGKLFSK